MLVGGVWPGLVWPGGGGQVLPVFYCLAQVWEKPTMVVVTVQGPPDMNFYFYNSH
jgi:hypothetical protein